MGVRTPSEIHISKMVMRRGGGGIFVIGVMVPQLNVFYFNYF